MSDFAPPPLRQGETVFCLIAMRDGQLYAAPLGTPYDLDVSEAWLKVDSTDDLRKFFGTQS